jgi:hypothetical protein
MSGFDAVSYMIGLSPKDMNSALSKLKDNHKSSHNPQAVRLHHIRSLPPDIACQMLAYLADYILCTRNDPTLEPTWRKDQSYQLVLRLAQTALDWNSTSSEVTADDLHWNITLLIISLLEFAKDSDVNSNLRAVDNLERCLSRTHVGERLKDLAQDRTFLFRSFVLQLMTSSKPRAQSLSSTYSTI